MHAYACSEQLRKNIIVGEYYLEVDLAHLIIHDEPLSTQLKLKPKEYIALVLYLLGVLTLL